MSAVSAKAPEPTMDEILASIRRIIADDGEAPNGAMQAGSRSPTDPRLVPPQQTLAPSEVAAPDDGSDADEVVADAAPPAAVPSRPEPVREPDVGGGAAPALALSPASLETLVSKRASDEIGLAFDALSTTVLTHNSRTLEDLVKEMLRPLLKAWLEDNLPPLVERLVRTEIERVARGRR